MARIRSLSRFTHLYFEVAPVVNTFKGQKVSLHSNLKTSRYVKSDMSCSMGAIWVILSNVLLFDSKPRFYKFSLFGSFIALRSLNKRFQSLLSMGKPLQPTLLIEKNHQKTFLNGHFFRESGSTSDKISNKKCDHGVVRNDPKIGKRDF